MDDLDKERLIELYRNRDGRVKPDSPAIAQIDMVAAAYWQGRIDEYAAQNAIDEIGLHGAEIASRS